jgi:ABC-2 type transport system permease protein
VIVAVLTVFSVGIAMLLSALFVSLRDIQPIWEVISQVLFYCSPVIISIETVQEKLSPTLMHIYMLNPLAVVFQQFRHAIINQSTPSVSELLGSWAAVLEPLAIVLAFFALGFWVFNRSAPLVAENL